MERDELRLYTLRRRRLIGLFFLVPFVLVVLAFNGWRPSPIWEVFDDDEGTHVAGDPFGEWIYAVCDGEQQQITVMQSGRLAGVDGLDSLRSVRFPNWCDLPTVDNPELPAWQAQLRRLEALTQAPRSSAEEILNVAREMPVSVLYLQPISDWIHADDSHAVGFLDAVAARPMEFHHPDWSVVSARKTYFSRLVGDALDAVASHGAAPEKLAAWLAEPQIVDGDRNFAKLAGLDGLDNDARAALLERLEAIRMPERDRVYATLGPHLVRDGRYAALLTEQLRLLPPHSRSAEAHRLLAQPDASIDFPIALLAAFPGTFHGPPDVQLDVFTAIAEKLKNEPEAPLLLTRHLKDIPGMQRRMAATHLLRLDDAGETAFALGVLHAFSDLHPISRPKLAYTVMQAEQFRDRRVQEACLLAVRLELSGRDKQELLSALLHHQALDPELYSRLRAEFT